MKTFLKDKYVLIGASAKGLFDTVKIPTGETVPELSRYTQM